MKMAKDIRVRMEAKAYNGRGDIRQFRSDRGYRYVLSNSIGSSGNDNGRPNLTHPFPAIHNEDEQEWNEERNKGKLGTEKFSDFHCADPANLSSYNDRNPHRTECAGCRIRD